MQASNLRSEQGEEEEEEEEELQSRFHGVMPRWREAGASGHRDRMLREKKMMMKKKKNYRRDVQALLQLVDMVDQLPW